ncbi:EAL domain-containing protein [uncultured Neptuniibacter sp.]|uniref:EAL domain-containing protein n=1 Tax=uncultured Neptuniibacter sp. TaxID=502143 RepID=UPI00261651B0|nr:EAL domain-containing protein [uncultured Neptuniibacter sp.]
MRLSKLRQFVTKLQAPALLSFVITLILISIYIYEKNLTEQQQHQRDLQLQAEQLSKQLDRHFSTINRVLIDVEPLRSECDNNVLYHLRSLIFNVAPVVEIGVVSPNGELICTSWQKHHQPLSVIPAPRVYGLRFGGIHTVEYMQQPAFVLARTLRDGSEVNALVRISWLENLLQSYTSELGFSALIKSDSGDPIVVDGYYSLPNSTDIIPLDQEKVIHAVFQNGREQLAAYSPLTTLPSLSVVISEEQSILNQQAYAFPIVKIMIAIVCWSLLTFLIYQFQTFLTDSSHQLKKAIRKKQFINHYQPIISAADNAIIGAEVLMRWQHPTEGLKSPITFIPEAQEKRLLNAMTTQQLENCYRQLKPLFKRYPDFFITVNISYCHLKSRTMVNELLRYHQLIPTLVLEVTEDVLIDQSDDRIRDSLLTLSSAGVKLAIDDFGTGYCGLSYLSQLPVNYLKADKSFVASLGTDATNARVLEMIVKLAKKLKLKVIAEGVETIEQRNLLDELQVEMHQGWLYSKAISAELLIEQVENNDVIFQ